LSPFEPSSSPSPKPADPLEREISPTQVQSWLANQRPFVWLDCREQPEYDWVHLPDSLFLPMSELVSRVEELQPYRKATLVVYCHHGVRSLQVAIWLQHQGFTDVRSLSGGIDRWTTEVDPTLPRY
jgi:rhodanese-related sulfurtransferase